MYFKKIILLSISLILSCFPGFGQLTIQIYGLPASTPENSSVFIAGNFNNWDPGNQAYRFQRSGESLLSLNVPDLAGPADLEFKFTQGSWDSVEGDESGSFLQNRKYHYPGAADTLRLMIHSWENKDPQPWSSTGSNVKIIDTGFKIPQLGRERRVWICFPRDYENSGQRYPVLYMNDGQNLFDAATSFSGEWQVDETVNAWTGKGFIVVGIDNGGDKRMDEYSPWPHPKYGGGEGDEYAAFLVQTLKPFIDKNYRTLKSRRYTGIMGSSMGGLISLYTAVEYQKTFGFAGIFSPALWLSDQWAEHIRQNGKRRPVQFYLLAGKGESDTMEQEVWLLAKTLEEAGFSPSQIAVDIDDDGQHTEWYWAREFAGAIHWWLGE